jgi:ribosomal protein S6E (S10)
MPFKINIGTKQGKTYKLETESEELVGKALGEIIQGKDVSKELEGYEFQIMGTSDISGFTSMADVEGIGLKKVLLNYGKSMHKRSKKEGKKKRSNPTPSGLRLRKTVRGKVISPLIVQINLKPTKEGSKKLSDIFPDQNKIETPTEKAKE